MRRLTLSCAAVALTAMLATSSVVAQDLAQGPFDRLVIRNVTLIDGTGGPPTFPVDIVVEQDRIVQVRSVGNDFGEINEERRPAPGDHEIDATGMYLMPGFTDAHVHTRRDASTEMDAAYSYYLWLGHGVTSVLDAGSGNGLEWTVAQRDSSAAQQIIAPRIFSYVRPGMSWDQPVTSAESAREWVRVVAEKGADGLKLGAHRPDIMEALIDEAHTQGLVTTAHLGQNGVTRMNALDAARLGLDHLQHWYGLAESMLENSTVPRWSFDYNQNNEQDRFSQAGMFWEQAADPGSDKWNALQEELVERDFLMVPTTSVYEFLRDVPRRRNLEWHDTYSSPDIIAKWEPNPDNHGSLYFYWTTAFETNWYHNFYKWQQFLNEFKNRGGRVAVGADEGSAYSLMGFTYIREMEMLQQAGFDPLEVVRSASMYGAEAVGMGDDLGTIEVGRIADMVLVGENPLENLKVLYGTGTPRYDPETRQTDQVGGVIYTIKDGVVYDAKGLLAVVADKVRDAKARLVSQQGGGS